MLEEDPFDRIDAASAISHQFFQEAMQDHEKLNQSLSGNNLALEQNNVWIQRGPRLAKNLEHLLSKMGLVDQIYLFHDFL